MIPYNSELFHSIYDGWLPLLSILMMLVILWTLAFPIEGRKRWFVKLLLVVITLIEFGGWVFIRYGFSYEPNASYRDITAAEPTATFFTLLGLTAIVMFTRSLPKTIQVLSCAAFGIVIANGLTIFLPTVHLWTLVALLLLVGTILGFLLLYTTDTQKRIAPPLRILFASLVWVVSSALMYFWLVQPGLG